MPIQHVIHSITKYLLTAIKPKYHLLRLTFTGNNRKIATDFTVSSLYNWKDKNSGSQFPKGAILCSSLISQFFAPLYSISSIEHLEKSFLNVAELKPIVLWRCMDDIFTKLEHRQSTSLTKFWKKVSDFHSANEFSIDWHGVNAGFSDVSVKVMAGLIYGTHG